MMTYPTIWELVRPIIHEFWLIAAYKNGGLILDIGQDVKGRFYTFSTNTME